MRACFNIIKNLTFYIIFFLSFPFLSYNFGKGSLHEFKGLRVYGPFFAGSSTQGVTGKENINGQHAVTHPNFNGDLKSNENNLSCSSEIE